MAHEMSALAIAGFRSSAGTTLLVVLDGPTHKVYYAQLVEEESTARVMVALCEVF